LTTRIEAMLEQPEPMRCSFARISDHSGGEQDREYEGKASEWLRLRVASNEFGPSPLCNRVAYLLHEARVEREIVQGSNSCAERLVGFEEVAEVGGGVAVGCWERRAFVVGAIEFRPLFVHGVDPSV